MKSSTNNGCKIYNLSSGKTMPQWLSKTKKKLLQKDEEYRSRLELIQDFEMPTASQNIRMTNDGEHIFITGTYPPSVKCFTTSDMSLKFHRGLTCEVVDMETLSDNYGKFVLLQADRTLNFHAPYGTHYSIRIPKFGRSLTYNPKNCDLYVSASGEEIYRLNLETGQFRESFVTSFNGCNKVALNSEFQLLACGGDNGVIEFWDPRVRRAINSIVPYKSGYESISNKYNNITALTFHSSGYSFNGNSSGSSNLLFGAGNHNGFCYLYDLRSSKPVHVKEHQNSLPIVDIKFHSSSSSIISCDTKLVKIWDYKNNVGKNITHIETPANINNLLIARDSKRNESGMLMIAGEQSRVMTYYIPELGPAPKWCSFLDGLTEELEEDIQKKLIHESSSLDPLANSSSNLQEKIIYDDYKFLTLKELEELNATSLIGTSLVHAYMHGYFVSIKLYSKLRSVAKPFEYQEHHKNLVKKKMNTKLKSLTVDEFNGEADGEEDNRIQLKTYMKNSSTNVNLPKINTDLAKKLLRKHEKDEMKKLEDKDKEGNEDDEIDSDLDGDHVKLNKKKDIKNVKDLVDDRFHAIFERKEFQQDEEDAEFKLRNPTQSKFSQQNKKKIDNDDIPDGEEGLYQSLYNHDDEYEDEEEDVEEEEYDDEEKDIDEIEMYGEIDEEDRKYTKKLNRKKNKSSHNYDTEEIGSIEKVSKKISEFDQRKRSSSELNDKKKKKMKMFTLSDGITSDEILYNKDKKMLKEKNQNLLKIKNLPLEQRLENLNSNVTSSSSSLFNEDKRTKKNSTIRTYKSRDQGLVKEISFIPSSNKKK